MESFDIVVIGAGSGGYPAAIRAAQLGASVAVIEKERLGGACLNWGCIPTKTLIASSSLYHRIRNADSMGIETESVAFNYPAMVKRKDTLINSLHSGVEQLLNANGVKVFKGAGSFLSRDCIVVDGAQEIRLTAKNFIIASGSITQIPAFVPKHERIVGSRKFLEANRLPASLMVLGGGVIGCEFACMAAQLGAKVTIIEVLEDIMSILDPDIRRELRRALESSLGIKILSGSSISDIQMDAEGVHALVKREEIKAEMMLVSVGRKPATAELALGKAGLEVTGSGHIEVDSGCATRVAGIYAVGDVTAGSTQLAHAATAQGVTAAENACGKTAVEPEMLVPSCIFTSPEIGVVGLTEKKAKELNWEVLTGKFLFSALSKALTSGQTGGFVKWIADAKTDRLLGAQAIGSHATELIAEATVAVRFGLTARALGKTVHSHPTFAEAWMEAAHAVHGQCIHAAPRRRPS